MPLELLEINIALMQPFFLHAHPVLVNLIVILFFHHVSSTA